MATTLSTSASGSISGIISGMDTDTIISKLTAFAQKPITLLQNQQTDATNKLTAWQAINTRLLALKIKADALAKPVSFQAKTTSVSDDTAFSATSTSDAVAGTYNITINRLAQAQQTQSQGYKDTDTTTVGSGTVTVGVGTAAKQITVDSSNNTLSGLRDAINKAGVGVTASITDLGSLSSHDYHLVLTSNSTGEANTIAWTPSLTGGTSATWTTTTAATNASVTIGTGATATTVTKASNSINDILPGVTLNLKTADVSKPLTLTVAADTTNLNQMVSDFVDQYNSLVTSISGQFAYNADTQQAGTLMGDYGLQSIQLNLNQVMDVVPGLSSDANSLSQIGISMQSDGTLSVDSSKLSSAIATTPNAVQNLFAGVGSTTDHSISFLGYADNTIENGGQPGYDVRIDQVATQTHVTAGVAQADNLAADETLTINGTAVSLTAGMTGQQVLDKINSMTDLTGVTAAQTGADGTGSGNYLTLTQNAYGSTGHISVVSSASNGGASPVTATTGMGNVLVDNTHGGGETGTSSVVAGLDVKGAFGVTVNGVETWEAATGTGQTLTGSSGNAHTEGLIVQSTATTTGVHGSVTLTRGVGAIFSKSLGYLTGKDGTVSTAEDALNSQISDLKTTITAQNDRVTAYADQIRTEFNNMESKLAELQGQGNYLTSQFNAMTNSKTS